MRKRSGKAPSGCGAVSKGKHRLERARELQAIIDNPTAGKLPNSMIAHRGDVESEQPVEEAEIQENLGEFPSQLGDQGDHLQAPV